MLGNELVASLSPQDSRCLARPMPLGVHWQCPQQPLENSTCSPHFLSHFSAYLKSKNESFKKEFGNIEEELNKAEETVKSLKATILSLGQTVNALENTLTAASSILSASLICTICLETCRNPTSLRCGHAFCRDCLQSWLFSKFETKCEDLRIDLTESRYSYLYAPTFTPSEAESNMLSFSTLSNSINPEYSCPSCRDPMLPSLRNSFLDFKLAASLTTLNTLIGYIQSNPPGWKNTSIDLLAFLNSRFFRRFSTQSLYNSRFDDVDIEM